MTNIVGMLRMLNSGPKALRLLRTRQHGCELPKVGCLGSESPSRMPRIISSRRSIATELTKKIRNHRISDGSFGNRLAQSPEP